MISYIYCVDEYSKESLGIIKKINSQVNSIENIGVKCNKYNYFHKDNYLNKILKRFLVRFPMNKKFNLNNNKNLKMVYVRYAFADSNLIKSLENIKKNNDVKMVLEIPTYPYNEELKWWVRKKDIKYSKQLNKYVDRVITFSDDDEIFGIKTIKTSNGIELRSLKEKKINTIKNTINLICVSSLAFWHGYDRIIESLNEYKKMNRAFKIKINIVGNGQELNKLKELVSKYNLQNNVIFHGNLTGKRLDDVFDESHIAISCLALHRKNILKVTSLKNREYCARGIPFIDCAIDNDFIGKKYVLKVDSNEELIDFNEIIKFAISNCNKEVSREMINYAKENLTWECKLKDVLKYYNEE